MKVKEAKVVDLPKKKVGIVACSGEELPEGTISRLAALKVLEQLRPQETVTICLPLFLAGGEGDRAFARYYPTIAIDGCEKRCAARGTERYSGKPAASIVVDQLMQAAGMEQPTGLRQLDHAGLQGVELVADHTAQLVDEILDKKWSRRDGQFVDDRQSAQESREPESAQTAPSEPVVASCECGSGIPVQKISINGTELTLIALPLIFEKFHQAGKPPQPETLDELVEMVKIYNPLPDDLTQAFPGVLLREYESFCERKETDT
jgi:uncharacterized metal-binding protein